MHERRSIKLARLCTPALRFLFLGAGRLASLTRQSLSCQLERNHISAHVYMYLALFALHSLIPHPLPLQGPPSGPLPSPLQPPTRNGNATRLH